jgi:threonine dehydrogenase-like Zn-dependent dehydrogenase
MRRVVMLDGAGRITVETEPMPVPKPGQVLVEVKACCISPGTELSGVRGRRENPDASGPKRAFGYSNAGVVVGSGEGCGDIAPGTRVACMGGGYALHASHAAVPRNLAVPIPEGVSFEAAATNHLAATALHAVRRGEFTVGEHVAVFGLGIVGYFCAQIVSLAGAHVLAIDRFQVRLGAVSATGFVERVVNAGEDDVVAEGSAFSRGAWLRRGDHRVRRRRHPRFQDAGADAQAGAGHAPDGPRGGGGRCPDRAPLRGGARERGRPLQRAARPGYHDPEWEHGRDYPPTFVQWTTRRNVEECLRFMALGRLKTDPLITHRFPLDEAPQACEMLIETPAEALGVILFP